MRTESSVLDYVVVSTVNGTIAGVLLLGITIVVARLSVEREWDMDNIAAPMITACGDILTLPAIVVATLLIGIPIVSNALAGLLILLAAGVAVAAFRIGAPSLRRILAESLPILALTGMVTILVGIALQDREEQFFTLLALRTLLSAFLQEGGAPGGILSSRLSSNVHLGLLTPRGCRP